MTWQFGVFLVLGAVLLVLELVGVVSPDKDDTITEGYRKALQNVPRPVAMILVFLTLGLLFWAGVHLPEGWF